MVPLKVVFPVAAPMVRVLFPIETVELDPPSSEAMVEFVVRATLELPDEAMTKAPGTALAEARVNWVPFERKVGPL